MPVWRKRGIRARLEPQQPQAGAELHAAGLDRQRLDRRRCGGLGQQVDLVPVATHLRSFPPHDRLRIFASRQQVDDDTL